eukprot:scaffold77192_cov37-Cyclotella_meneghiniana.AAC.3
MVPKRNIGCEYVNSYNRSISEVFNCNCNIQVGDPAQVYYSTLYSSKSTQAEDSERQRRVCNMVLGRLWRIQKEIDRGERSIEETPDGFAEGLCRMLSGINAATSRYVVSSTMAHLLVCQNGSRFTFSHDFGSLLVTQMEATLEGADTDVRIRTNRWNGETVAWVDSSTDDYPLHRPRTTKFENYCAYEQVMLFQKEYLHWKDIKSNEDASSASGTNNHHRTIKFSEDHPGYHFTHLKRCEQWVIPRIFIPPGKICPLKNLKLSKRRVDELTTYKREAYAKYALLMFYPFRTLNDLRLQSSYWKLFASELKRFRSGKSTKFWARGFTILQNMENRLSLEKDIKRARDEITRSTSCTNPNEKENSQTTEDENWDDMAYDPWDADNNDYSEDNLHDDIKFDSLRTQNDIIQRCSLDDSKFINPRIVNSSSLFRQTRVHLDSSDSQIHSRDPDKGQSHVCNSYPKRSFQTVIKLIAGALVSDGSFDFTVSFDGVRPRTKIPTIDGFLHQYGKENNVTLDDKQSVVYRTITCTFLLQLLLRQKRDNDSLETSLDQVLFVDSITSKKTPLLEELKS